MYCPLRLLLGPDRVARALLHEEPPLDELEDLADDPVSLVSTTASLSILDLFGLHNTA